MLKVVLSVIVVVALVGAEKLVLSEEKQKLLKTVHETCVTKSHAPEDVIEKIHNGDHLDDANSRCYVKCFMQETALMNDSGEFDFGALEALVDEKDQMTKMQNILEDCSAKVTDSDTCEKAYKTYKCAYETDKELFKAL